MSVVWKAIPGFEDYEASSLGEIRRATPGRRTFPGKILRPQKVGSGYRGVSFTVDGKNVQRSVHRMVMLAFVGAPGPGEEVNHPDGDKANNALANLEYVNRSGNVQHAIALGLVKTGEASPKWRGGPKPYVPKPAHRGERHWTRLNPAKISRGESRPSAKLTADQVADIRRAVSEGAIQRELASKYKVGASQICRIVKGVRWS